MKPSEVVRKIIGKRMGVQETRKGELLQCLQAGHRLLPSKGMFVIHPPKTSNDPALSDRLVDTVRENRAWLIWSKPSSDRATMDVWAVPSHLVLDMWKKIDQPTRDRDGSHWDTRMDREDDKWYWRPCGNDRAHLALDVTAFHELWPLTEPERAQFR